MQVYSLDYDWLVYIYIYIQAFTLVVLGGPVLFLSTNWTLVRNLTSVSVIIAIILHLLIPHCVRVMASGVGKNSFRQPGQCLGGFCLSQSR